MDTGDASPESARRFSLLLPLGAVTSGRLFFGGSASPAFACGSHYVFHQHHKGSGNERHSGRSAAQQGLIRQDSNSSQHRQGKTAIVHEEREDRAEDSHDRAACRATLTLIRKEAGAHRRAPWRCHGRARQDRCPRRTRTGRTRPRRMPELALRSHRIPNGNSAPITTCRTPMGIEAIACPNSSTIRASARPPPARTVARIAHRSG
jgi:hypothetical protein